MIVPPRKLMNVGAAVASALMAHRWTRADTGHAAQRRSFAALTEQMAQTAFGRTAGIEAGMRYEKFRARVMPRTYDALSPFIERMQRGEPAVLWPGRCNLFVRSAGTVDGRAKFLPVTRAFQRHLRTAEFRSLLFYTIRVGHTRVLHGRHLKLGSAAALEAPPGASRGGVLAGDLGAIASRHAPFWLSRHAYPPGAAGHAEAWPARLQAIADHARRHDVRLLAGIPNWLLLLGEALRASAADRSNAVADLRTLWPHLECLVHEGIPLAPFAEELKTLVGSSVSFHEIYLAAEGFIAAQDADAASGLRLLVDTGLFFEFLPMTVFDSGNLDHLGGRAVPLDEVRVGIDYALMLTTPAGLCRYLTGDVIRFVSTGVPRVAYVGRTSLRLDAFGEHVDEKTVTESLAAVCQRHGWTVVSFHLAPVFASTLTGQTRGRHEWWIELKAPTIETPTANILSPELDGELARRHGGYLLKRDEGTLDEPVVRLVMPGVFAQWMKKHDRWGGQHKMPRCRSDRVVADQLAELSRFYIETKPPYFVRQP